MERYKKNHSLRKHLFIALSPYAVSKLYAYWISKNYEESFNIYACNGILFNHESPRRGETFVTRKITLGLNRIALGLEKCLFLGNLYPLEIGAMLEIML